MKSFFAGLITIILLGIVGFYTFKSTTKLMTSLNPSPSASPTESASPSTTPKPTPDRPVDENYVPTTKGGLPIVKTGTVKGVSTIKTTTTTTSHLFLTLIKSNTCPVSYMTEIKDISGPLTLKYSLKDGYSFGLTAWKKDGNELIQNTTYSGTSGTIKTVSGVDYMKVRIESKTCSPTSDNWLTVTAER